MKSIWKYAFTSEQVISFTMPRDAKILCVDEQDGDMCLWAEVEVDRKTEIRQFAVIGTGWDIHEDSYSGLTREYIGTVQQMSGALIWHIFELVT